MLKVKAEIKFTLEGKNYPVGDNIFRPAFGFRNGLIFSGDIYSNDEIYYYNKKYTVDIDFFTIDEKSYPLIHDCLDEKSGLVICAGRKILGLANIVEYTYET